MTAPDVSLELLRRMKRIRLVEEAIAARYGEGKMRCPTHLCVGQEAVSAAAGLALRPDDFAVSGHRAHGHYLGKGGDLKRMLAEIYGKAAGCCRGKGGSMHLIDTSVGFMGSTAIVSGTIPVGVGLGLSIRLKKTDQVSCVFFGDAGVEEGVFYESLNFAVLKKLPVLFVCENNFYSVYSGLGVRQPAGRKIHEMARAMGCPAAEGDGNDALAAYDLLQSAIGKVRGGEGPYFLELTTYRWREHCGPEYDNHLGYRTEREFLDWKAKDPIPRLEARVAPAAAAELDAALAREIEEAFAFAESSPFPAPEDAYTDLVR